MGRPLETIYEDFNNINKMTPSAERNASYDHAAYLLLFIASYLARYRPEKWKRIVDGINEEWSMVVYRRVMEHASELYQKLASAIYFTALGRAPSDVLNAESMTRVENMLVMDGTLKSP